MLNIYYSNKIEVLAKQLAALCHFKPLSALSAENIVVESAAMQHWLTDALSKELGIIANIQFPFPAALVWKIYRLQMPELAKQSSFDRNALVWRLFALLNDDNFSALYPQFEHSALTDYLSCLNDDLQCLRFCQQLAGLYDQYQIYRPDWLLHWRQGETVFSDNQTAQWQSALWRLLCQQDSQQEDRSSIFQRSLQLFPLAHQDAVQVAQRLNIFAVSTLAKSYLDLFASLAESIEVNVFVLNPCSVYWSDIQTQKQIVQRNNNEENTAEGHNELLALLAKQSREYLELLQDYEQAQTHELYVDNIGHQPPGISEVKPSLLQHLQQDILHLRQNAMANLAIKVALEKTDDSLQIHSCHSPLREVQVLHDRLLDYLQSNQDALLDDIAIMVPDLEHYAPFIHAVFSSQANEQKLAYHLCERQQSEQGGIKATLLQLLQLSQQQFNRDVVVSIMREPSVAAKFSFRNQALLETLLEQLQLRFGLNDDTWYAMSHSDNMVSYAWQQVKTRLLASFVVPTDLNNELAYTLSGIENDAAAEAGFLCHFIDQLSLLNFNKQQTAQQWTACVENILQHFFVAEDEVEQLELRSIREGLSRLKDDIALSGFDGNIDAEVFYAQLESVLATAANNHFYRPGCINIATLLPLRSMPFKFIAVLGLNDGDYPRPTNTDQMDLMVQHPRHGDRNRRDEDRYLFLEVLLASRQQCHFSFIGRSQVDNSERYPSLLLSELIKHIDKHYTIDGQANIAEHLVYQHALQAFDQRYFNSQRFYSYSQQHLSQAQALQKNNQPAPKLLAANTTLALPSNDKSVDLSLIQLVSAIKDPSAHLLATLNIHLEHTEHQQESLEAFNSDGLMSYQILNNLFEHMQISAASDVPQSAAIDANDLRRAGLLAQSSVGDIELAVLTERAQTLQNHCKQHYLSGLTLRRYLELRIDNKAFSYLLHGEINRLNSENNQRLAWFGRTVHGAHIIKAWVEHLACQCSLGELNSYLVSEQGVYKMAAIPSAIASELLSDIISMKQENSVCLSWFFPKAGWAYCEAINNGEENKAMALMEAKLLGVGDYPGEWHAASNHFAYRGYDNIETNAIIAAAERVFLPLLDYWQELSA